MSLSIENKSVFPVVSPECKGSITYEKNYHSLDKRIQPLTVEDVKGLKEAGIKLPSVCNEGSILMRHPYRPDTLIDMDLDISHYLQEKFGDYAVILNYLGAKDQTLKGKITTRETRKLDANGKLNFKGKGSLKGTFKRFTSDRYEVKYSKHITASGGCNYEKAKKYAEKEGLLNDPFVREILELRKDQPIDTYEADVIISKDYSDIIDAAANLQIMSGAFSLGGNFKKDVSTREQISISQNLSFSMAKIVNML